LTSNYLCHHPNYYCFHFLPYFSKENGQQKLAFQEKRLMEDRVMNDIDEHKSANKGALRYRMPVKYTRISTDGKPVFLGK
jgi:DNA-directed RNA polymerase delta subunit